MKTSVSDIFPSFSTTYEGRLNFMYLDIKQLVTTGIGNLIDPISLALPLPWTPKSDPGRAATPDEVTAEWNLVKSDPDGRSQRGGAAFGSVTTLQLSDAAIDDLVVQKLNGMAAFLQQRAEFAAFEDWPADAQLGLLSMAWAMGPGFQFPKFQAACASLDFTTAASECQMSETGNAGLHRRNEANRQLFLAAADAVAGNLDPNEVHLS